MSDSVLANFPIIGYQYNTHGLWVLTLPEQLKNVRIGALANDRWHDVFPNAQLENLVTLASDHYPILLNLEIIIRVRAHRNFKYENAWIVLSSSLAILSKKVGDEQKD